jgi:hypothetical protein
VAPDEFLPRHSAGAGPVRANAGTVAGQLRSVHVDRISALSRGAAARTHQRALYEGLHEVKAFGSLGSDARTAEQTKTAYFWSENFVAQWNRAMRGIADKHIHKTGDSARLFALANLALADALITAWESKNFYVFWRPLTAIVEGTTTATPTRPETRVAAADQYAELPRLHFGRETTSPAP